MRLKIDLPKGWSERKDPGGPALYVRDVSKGSSGLQISWHEEPDAPRPVPDPPELLQQANSLGEDLELGRLVQSTCGPCPFGSMGGAAFVLPDRWSRIWFLSDGRHTICATHLCTSKPDPTEEKEVQEIVSGLSLCPDKLGGREAVIRPGEVRARNPAKNSEARIFRDKMVEFKSRIGNKVVYPSQWSVEDNGDNFVLTSLDGRAAISFSTYLVEGSGSFTEFQDLVISIVEGDWEDSEWTDIKIGRTNAKRRHFIASDESAETTWRIYVLRAGKYYHAILMRTSPLMMQANGTFYEGVVRTFVGIAGSRS